MTRKEALQKLQQATELVFEVESVMNITTSNVRRKGYWARISISDFVATIKHATNTDSQDISIL